MVKVHTILMLRINFTKIYIISSKFKIHKKSSREAPTKTISTLGRTSKKGQTLKTIVQMRDKSENNN